MDKRTVYGPPGTGKTTFLMQLLEEELTKLPPGKIAFVSFTKKGTYEGVARAKEKFSLVDQDLPFFRTIHSLCFRELNRTKEDIISKAHYKLFSQVTGIAFTGYYTEDYGSVNDTYLHTLSMRKHNPRWASKLEANLQRRKLNYIATQYDALKKQLGVVDFDDLLQDYLTHGTPLPVKVAFIDEAQDLTPLQWDVALKMFSLADRIVVAGDDDQAVYEWAGADVKRFLNFSRKFKILNKSYRLPACVWELAKRVTEDIKLRQDKEFTHNGEEGVLRRTGMLYKYPFLGDELILARTNYILRGLVPQLQQKGVHYTLKGKPSVPKFLPSAVEAYQKFTQSGDSEVLKYAHFFSKISRELPWYKAVKGTPQQQAYYENLFVQGTPLKAPVRLDTFHSSKGGEADTVIVIPDLSARVSSMFRESMDAELRCLYVGLTRAKKNLVLVEANTKHHFPLVYFKGGQHGI